MYYPLQVREKNSPGQIQAQDQRIQQYPGNI